MAAQEDFVDLRQYFVDPIQHDYEVIRPIVLFAETAAERSRQTGVERTGGRQSSTLCPRRHGRPPRPADGGVDLVPGYPDAIAGYIPLFKTTLSPHPFMSVRIVHRKFGYKTNHHTLKRFLAPDIPHQPNSGASHFRHLCRCLPRPLDGGPYGGGRMEQRVLRTASSCRGPMSIRFWRPLNGMALRAWRSSARGHRSIPRIS